MLVRYSTDKSLRICATTQISDEFVGVSVSLQYEIFFKSEYRTDKGGC
jgi:hypothetical protein